LTSGGFSFVKGETNAEFEATLKDNTKTPDIVETSFSGNGSPCDFYVDVKTPDPDYLWKKASIQRYLNESWENRKNQQLENHILTQEEKDMLVRAINKRCAKYRRGNSPLFGIVYYFDMRNISIIPCVIQDAPYNFQITWEISRLTQKSEFKKQIYLYKCFFPLVDSMLGTGLVRTGDASRIWGDGVRKVFDKFLRREPVSSFIEIPSSRMHGFCTFFLILVDLPNNIQQKLFFYCIKGSNNRRYEYVLNNKIFKHLRKMAEK